MEGTGRSGNGLGVLDMGPAGWAWTSPQPRGGLGSRLSEPVGAQCTIQILACWEGSEQHIYIYIYIFWQCGCVLLVGLSFFLCVFFFSLSSSGAWKQQKKCSFIQCQENAVIYQG